MPRLSITHRTTYRYRRPVELQPHKLMLRPRGSQELQVAAFDLRCSPGAGIAWGQDVHGNLVASAEFTGPASMLELVADYVVEQSAPECPIFRIATHAHAYPFTYAAADIVDLGVFRPAKPSRLTETPTIGEGCKSIALHPRR